MLCAYLRIIINSIQILAQKMLCFKLFSVTKCVDKQTFACYNNIITVSANRPQKQNLRAIGIFK